MPLIFLNVIKCYPTNIAFLIWKWILQSYEKEKFRQNKNHPTGWVIFGGPSGSLYINVDRGPPSVPQLATALAPSWTYFLVISHLFARNKQRLLSWTRKKQTFLLAKLQNCWNVIANILSVSFLVSCQAEDKYEIFPYFSPVRNTNLFLPNAHWFDAINCLTNGATEVKVWKHVCAA